MAGATRLAAFDERRMTQHAARALPHGHAPPSMSRRSRAIKRGSPGGHLE